MTIRVLIADDEAMVRGGFAMILRPHADIEVVGEAGDGGEAVRIAGELCPDVVLMDIRMPGVDGLEATRRILGTTARHKPRVLILTTFDADSYVYEALRAGASGFLLKDAPPEQLVPAIRTVASGDALMAPSVMRRLVESYVRRGSTIASGDDALAELTGREREVLALVGRGLANADIAAALYVTEATVKTHLAHVFSKLGLRDRAQAVVVAYETGLVEAGGGPS